MATKKKPETRESTLDDLIAAGYRYTPLADPAAEAAPPAAAGSSVARRALGDTGIAALKGAIGLPEALVGMTDIVTGGRAGKLAEQAGFRPKEAKAVLDEYLSPEQQAANAAVQNASGFVDKLGAAVTNPSVIWQSAVESAPSMLGGAGVARGVLRMAPKASPVVAAGLGEGAVSAGQTAEQVRQETADGLLTGKQATIAGTSGALTGLLGMVAGKVAQKMGIGDVDTLLTGVKTASPTVQKGVVRRILEGALSEGALEELPQSVQEQVAQNLALNKPLDEGVDHAAVLGMLAGGLMGAAAGPLHSGETPAGKSIRDEKVPEVGPLTRAVNAVTETRAKQADAGMPVVTPDQAALEAQTRLTELDQKAKGTKDETHPGPDGKPVKIPGTPAQYLTDAERQEREFLSQNAENPEALARAGGATVANVAPGRDPEQVLHDMHRAAAEDAQGLRQWGKDKPPAAAAPAAAPAGDAITEADARRRMAGETFGEIPPTGDDIREALDTRERQDAQTRTLYADILNPKGQPFKNRMAATLAQTKNPGTAIVPVADGFVLRPTETKEPGNVGMGTPAATGPDGSGGTGAAQPGGSLGDRGRPAAPASGAVPVGTAPAAAPAADARVGDGGHDAAVAGQQARWDATLPNDRLGVLARAGWVGGEKSKSAQRLLNTPWAKLSDSQRTRIGAALGAEQPANISEIATGADSASAVDKAMRAAGMENWDSDNPKAPRYWKKDVGQTSEVHAQVVSKDGEPQRIKVTAKILTQPDVSSEVMTPEAAAALVKEYEGKIEQFRQRAAARVVAERTGKVESKNPPAIDTSAKPVEAVDTKPAAPDNESQQDRSWREWRENYEQVVAADDLSKFSEAQVRRAINYGAKVASNLGPKAWDGDESAKKQIASYRREVELMEFHLKTREKPAAAPAPKPDAGFSNGQKLAQAMKAARTQDAPKQEAPQAPAGEAKPAARSDAPRGDGAGQGAVPGAPAAAPAQAAGVSDAEKKAKALSDLNDALGDLANLFGKDFKANMMPEQEQKLMPVLTRVMDAAFRAGYYSFKQAARFVVDTIRQRIGAEVADAITLDHLQGAYIGMAGKYKEQGATSKRDVVAVESLDELRTETGPAVETPAPSADTEVQEPSDGTNQTGLGAQDQAGSPGARSERGSGAQQPDAQVDPGDLGEGKPGDVGAPASGESRGPSGEGAASPDVGAEGGTDAGRPAGDGRTRGSRARNPDAGTGSRAGKRPARSPAAPATDDLFAGPVDSPRPEEPVAPESVSPANAGPGDFVIADPLKVVGGGQVARFEKNKAAIELRNTLIEAGRAPTREEQEVLAGYTGWGSFGQELFQGNWAKPAPKQGWEARDRWLRDNLGQSEWEGLQTSIINAHYTDPPTVMAMWEMVRRLGFTGGRTLEPSIGIGNFYGLMPVDMASRSQRAGIELDEVTGSMAQMLYPNANIQIKGYEESTTPDNFYDVVIGNWPFSEIKPADRRYNRLGPNLHDYFFLKALDQTRPGGLVVGITTKGTMDKKAVNVRMEMARKAELVAAFRLPSGAFEEYAGTKVVTDIIILRKRDKPQQLVDREGWIEVLDHPTKEGTAVPVNEYFHRNPTHVIGEIDFGHGTTTMRPGLIVHRPADMMEQLRRIVALVPESQWQASANAKSISYVANHTSDRTNALVKNDKGFFIVAGEYMAPANEVAKYTLKDEAKTAVREQQLGALIDMRRLYGRLIDAERTGDAEQHRTALRGAYEAFVKAHGPLSESFGLGYLEKIDDPFYPALAALEIATPGAKGKPAYRPATILSQSTMRGARKMEAPSIADAFVLARNESVNPSVDRIAELSGEPAQAVREKLIGMGAAFELPNGDFAPADIYLSGNVREKLRQAQAGLDAGNKAMEHNVAELKKVQPPDVPYYKIETQMGATWVPAATYADFIAHMLGLDSAADIQVDFQAGSWRINFDSALNHRPEARSGFGSPNVWFKRLVRAAIANQTITVRRKDSDGTEYVDEDATKEVNGKISDMRLKFGEWIWKDPTRRVALEREYNEVRNAYATPRFDGSFLSFQGMALSLGRGPFELREHQVNAIWRALVTRKSLNAHEVGTGKTFTMGGIAVESRRYGIAKKPLLFAHNANSKSVAHEIQMMYPAAKVLYVDNLSAENIKTRMMQIANDDWDAVVVPHSLIDRIGFKEETLMGMAKEEIADLEIAAEEAADEDGATITSDMWDDEEELKKLRSPTAKQLVKARMKIISTIKKLAMQASKDGAVSFEDMGVDMILVDEAHEFKKPPIATKMRMKGLQTQTSDRSIAMMFLTKYVRSMNSGANVHLFTGTPITNTMTEVFHMMRYMMQEEMQSSGLADWDGWFGSFAREVNDVELNPAGEYEAVTRLQSFINVPELRRMIGQYMDVVFSDDMPEMRPRSVNGKLLGDKSLTDKERAELLNGRTEPTKENPAGAQDRPYKKVINESSDMTPEQMRVFERVQGYARAWRNMAKKDRKEAMLSGAPESPIIHEGIAARASFDVRLVDAIRNAGKEGSPEMAPHPDSKPARVVKNLLDLYRSDDRVTQVVFMEQGMSTSVTRREGPAGGKRSVSYPAFSTMKDMIERLVQAGIPREQIAAVTGATSKDKRKEIADAMNTGKVRIVFGSSDSLGVGVNMQRNLRAMHHMDAPWMPGELEQRNGRGHRQGNQWNTVLEYRYLTDRLDGRRWQVLAIKQRFITDFMKSKGEARVIEGDAASDEQGDILSTFSEAAGDPRILIREKLKKKLEALQSRERLHGQAQADARGQVRDYGGYLADMERKLAKIRESGARAKVIALIEAQAGEGFRATIAGKEFDSRAEASEYLEQWAAENMRQGAEAQTIGTYAGLDLRAGWKPWKSEADLFIKVAGETIESNGLSFASIDSRLRSLRDTIEAGPEEAIAQYKKTIAHAKTVAAEPFHLGEQLAAAEKQLADLQADLDMNPVAPPFWLRAGAPVDTEVYRDGKPFIVSGHRWAGDGWFVLGRDDKGQTAIPYLKAQDKQGLPLYEEREFEPPTVQQGSAGAGVPVTTPKVVNKAVLAVDEPAGSTNLSQTGSPEANETDVVFSRGPRKDNAARLQDLIDVVSANWENAPPIVVATNMQDPRIPQDARDEDAKQRKGGATGTPEGFYYRGKVYILTDGIGGARDALRVLFHETLGHHGLRGAFGRELGTLLDRLAILNQGKVRAKAKQYGLDYDKPSERRRAAEEVLAEMAQTNPKLGWVQQAIAKIRAFLREIVPGFNSMKFSDAEIIDQFILPARAWVEGNTASEMPGQGEPATVFNRTLRRGTEEEAIAAGFTMKAYRGVSKSAPFNDTDSTWLTTSREVAEVYGEEVFGYDDPGVLTVMVKPDGLVRRDASRMTDEEREELGQDEWGNPQAIGIYDRSDDHPLGGSRRGVTVIHAPKDAVFVIDDGGAMFSRARDALDTLRSATTARGLSNLVADRLNSDRTLNWWHRSIGTQYQKAQDNPLFKPVYDAAQDYLHDTSAFANDAAALAPDVVPQLKGWRDVAPKFLGGNGRPLKLSDEDGNKLAAALFQGTLDDLRVYEPDELRARFGMNDRQIGLYQQTRRAIDRSLDILVATDVARFIGQDLPGPLKAMISDGNTGRFRGLVTAFAQQKKAEAQDALKAVRKANKKKLAAMWAEQKKTLEGTKPGSRLAIEQALEDSQRAIRAEVASAEKSAQAELDRWTDFERTTREKYERIDQLKEQGYAPLMRFGQYTVYVEGPLGEQEFFGLYESQAEANKAAREFRESDEFKDSTVTTGVLSEEAYKQFSGMAPETLELFAEVSGVEKTPLFDEYLRRAKSNRSALKRLIKRKGIAGYSEDAQRVLASFLTSNARAASTNLHMGDMDRLVEAIQKENGDVKDEAIKLKEYVQNPTEEAGRVRGLLFVQYLGGSIASALVNMTQPFMMTFPYLSQFGGAGKAAARLGAAMKDSIGKIDPKTPLGRALAKAEKEGIVSPQELHQLQAESSRTLGNHPALRRGLFLWGSAFALAEQFNRRTSFIAAYRTATEQGMADPFKFAADAVDSTQGVYNRGNRPNWARGAVGATLFTFKQYSVSYLEFLKRLPPKERAIALLVLALAAGAQGLPFADDLDDLIDTLGQNLGYDTNAKAWKNQVFTDVLGEAGADFALHGFSAIPGFPLDVSGRLAIGNLIPGTGILLKNKTDKAGEVFDVLGPAGGFARDALKGEVRPLAIRNLAKGIEMYQTGQYRDSRDRRVVDVTGVDAFVKGVGFQPAEVARESRKIGLSMQQVQLARVVEGEIATTWAQGLADKEPDKVQEARERLRQWNADNPRSRIAINSAQIQRRVREMRLSRQERFQKTIPREMKATVE